MSQTATPEAARAHARAQAATSTWDQATIPATAAVDLPEGVDPATRPWDETIGSGGYTARALDRGTTVRLTDLRGDACANVLVYCAPRPIERLNVADTVKVQWQAYLGAGSLLLSDMGRVLLSISADSGGGHDALCGASNSARNAAKYGSGGVHESVSQRPRPVRGRAGEVRARPSRHRAERQLLQARARRRRRHVALRRRPDRAPAPTWSCSPSFPVILVVANTPHVLDPRTSTRSPSSGSPRGPIPPTTRADPLWSSSPEAERAFLNTEDLVRSDPGVGRSWR